MIEENKSRYMFTKYFFSVFTERTGLPLDEDTQAQILANCNSTEPYKKIDDKGRNSHYFTMNIHDKLITVVCDGQTHKIITCIIETHHRKEFGNL